MNTKLWGSAAAALLVAGLAGCHKTQATQSYEAVPVERRNLVVSASASGAIEPVLTVDVKSKASGEIIGMNVQTGDDVKQTQLLASIDPTIRVHARCASSPTASSHQPVCLRESTWRSPSSSACVAER